MSEFPKNMKILCLAMAQSKTLTSVILSYNDFSIGKPENIIFAVKNPENLKIFRFYAKPWPKTRG